MVFILLSFILLAVSIVWAFLAGYLLLLTLLAWFGSKTTSETHAEPQNRFLFVIPAHNEERLIGQTIQSIQRSTYPSHLYEIITVADNCTDQTAEIARSLGSKTYERFNQNERGKGYALQWLLSQIWDEVLPHDGLIFIDADTQISPNLLTVADQRFKAGQEAIQVYYSVLNAEGSWSAALRYAALAVLHYLRPLGRGMLGGSAGLKGNGMIFSSEIARNHEWTSSLTEDIEFHMDLILDGQRVYFAPDAIVSAEMPDSLEGSETQNERWEQGRQEMAKKYAPLLLRKAFSFTAIQQRQSFMLFDAAMEHIIPPFTIIFGGSIALTVLSTLLFLAGLMFNQFSSLANIALVLSIFGLIAQVIYLLSGLVLVKAPRSIYLSLAKAPGYLFWKVYLYIKVIFGRQQNEWIRTARND